MFTKLIKIAVLWVVSCGIIAFVLNTNKEDEISQRINQRITTIIDDQLMNLKYFPINQSMMNRSMHKIFLD